MYRKAEIWEEPWHFWLPPGYATEFGPLYTERCSGIENDSEFLTIKTDLASSAMIFKYSLQPAISMAIKKKQKHIKNCLFVKSYIIFLKWS